MNLIPGIKSIQILVFLLIFIVSGQYFGCKDDGISDNSGTVELSSSGSAGGTQTSSGSPVILEIYQVKILLKDVKLISESSAASESNFVTGPFVISLDLTSSVNFVVSSRIPSGTYDKVKFEVHKLEPEEVPPDPEFADANGRYSVIIKGRYNGILFVYKSAKSCHQMIRFPNSLLVNVGGKSNITLKVQPYTWFIKNGVILDPMNAININDIDNNIKENINENFKIFVDIDRNGQPD